MEQSLYFALNRRCVVPALMMGNRDSVRPAFRLLLAPDGIGQLIERANVGGWDWEVVTEDRGVVEQIPRPFVPGLGALALSPRAQLDHRALRRESGWWSWPPHGEDVGEVPGWQPTDPEMPDPTDLDDTFAAETTGRAANLARALRVEGTAYSFKGTDESTFHIALSIEPKRGFATRPAGDGVSVAQIGAGFVVQPRVYIHLFPYGVVSCWVCGSLRARVTAGVRDHISVLRRLAGRRVPPEQAFRIMGAGEPALALPALAGRLAERVAEAIAPTTQPLPCEDDYLALRLADPLDDREVAGLLTLDDRFESFSTRFVGNYASLYGRFEGDRVVATGKSFVAAVNPHEFSPSARRNFFWRLLLVVELALAQRDMFPILTSAVSQDPSEARPRAIAEHLLDVHRGLPAHHRKWYYECREALGVERRASELERALTPAGGVIVQQTTITVSGGQIGTLNLGTIVGDINNNLTVLDQEGQKEVAEALKHIGEAILEDDRLDDDGKRDLTEHVQYLSGQALKPKGERSSIVKSALEHLEKALAIAGSAAGAWSQFGPVLLSFFAVL